MYKRLNSTNNEVLIQKDNHGGPIQRMDVRFYNGMNHRREAKCASW